MSDISKQLDKLSPEKRKLFELMLEEKRAQRATQAPSVIPRRTADAPSYPVSFGQQRLWFLDQWEPGNPAYNLLQTVRLTGQLNTAALRRSINAIIERHEILRTYFETVDGQPMQVIVPALELDLPTIDLKQYIGVAQEAQIHQYATEFVRSPFVLHQVPLLRAILLRLSPDDHVLLLAMHHIISDGWSNGVLLQEIGSCYLAFDAGTPLSLPELPIQYTDFAMWQRQWLEDSILNQQLPYWQENLKDAPDILHLPTDRPRPANQTFDGARHYLAFSDTLTKRLKQFSKQEEVSLFTTLLAAFKVLLSRYTHQKDLLVGTPLANRNRTEIEGLIGFFVNTLVIRTDLTRNPTFHKMLHQVHEGMLHAQDHQDVPFERLVEALRLERNRSHPPLFQVMFVLQNAPMPALQLPHVTLQPLDVDSGTAQFDLLLDLHEDKDIVRGFFQYNTNLFDAITIARMEEHFCTLLTGIIADPDQHIDTIPFLSDAEYTQILHTWNHTVASYPQQISLTDLITTQIKQTPHAIAVSIDSSYLTFEALDQRANHLVHYLHSVGVGPETLVGVFLERSLDLVVSLLAILKTGGAYVPLDPDYPTERLGFMSVDAELAVIITHQHLAANLPPLKNHVIYLDQMTEFITPTINLYPKGTNPDNLAYVIYTSGSTGRPKGAMNSHRAICNRLLWMQENYHLTGSDRVLQKTPFSFDVSVWEFFWPLVTGARIVLARPQGHRDSDYLIELITTELITTLHFVPSMLQIFLENPNVDHCCSLQNVFCSGEALPATLVQRFFSRLDVTLHNLYGPTEAAIDVSFWPCQKEQEPRSIPIGYPISNIQLYVLDTYFQPVPIGITGELHIGGIGLARGYLHRPALTAERFVPHPYSQSPGERLYKTGDLAHVRSDGAIEYLGRSDYQIKIRGFRVELGEIEAVLSRYQDIREAVVIVHEYQEQDSRLVAYLVSNTDAAPSINELRTFTQTYLPDYMVPSAYIFLEAIPLSSNGKVDRAALPVPEQIKTELTPIYVTPRSSIEDTIAGIWTDILRLDRVGVYDNFFELGGHSLLATQVISRISDTFAVNLSLRTLFDGPTVAYLADQVEEARASQQGMSVPPITPVTHISDLPLSLAQERLWLVDQLVPGNIAYISTGAARITGPLHEDILSRCFNEIVQRHAILHTSFFTVKGVPVQRIHEAHPFSFTKVDVRDQPETQRESEAMRIAVDQARKPFNLAEDVLMRATLVQLDDEEYILALATHHIIYDLMSIGVFLREMRILYEAFTKDLPSPLDPLPVQYADFAYWQQQWMSQEIMEAQLPYWKQRLANANLVLELPTDRPRPPVQTFNGARYGMSLPLDLTNALMTLGHKEHATPYMLLLATFNVLLYRYTGQQDIIVGSPIANRTRTEVEGLIGFFVNILALRTEISGSPTFRELLQRVREVALGAYMHQDLPFAHLVEEMQPERDMSRNPIFQVMFNFLHNYMMPVPALMDLQLDLLRVHAETEQFDLSLDFWERPEGLQGSIDYNTDLFDEATIVRMIGHIKNIFVSITADPDQPISTLPMLSAEEQKQLFGPWSKGKTSPVDQQCIHALFETQVARTPDTVAVQSIDSYLTYRKLNQCANQLAHHLQVQGVTSGVHVGVCIERSIEMIIILWGVLKAGGTYVPLDPLYPQERLSFMIKDAQVSVIVTQRDLAPTLPTHNLQLVCIDDHWPEISQQNDQNLPADTLSTHLAYTIYTSGSTGQPKGTMIHHGALVNHTMAAIAYCALESQDRVLQFATINFDTSAEEIYPCLVCGATLVLRTDEMLNTAATFLDMCTLLNITILDLPTAYWHELTVRLHSDELTWPATTKLGIIGGERANPERFLLWQQMIPNHVRLINTYGPTEATVVTTWSELSNLPNIGTTRRELPIGSAIQNTQTYILDSYFQTTPICVPGELYISGVGLARGYLRRPAVTAEYFVPHPYSQTPGERLYKTGDLARYLSDGHIEYQGRSDRQVKIRGFRIELGEITAVLNLHPSIYESIVVATEDISPQTQLVAYIVLKTNQTCEVAHLRAFLKDSLPEYMVPNFFIELQSLPVTPNGKLDHKALPKLDRGQAVTSRTYEAPRSTLEEVVASIWAELLDLERVGIQDNFFELGGHSLLATQIISQLRETFEIEISLQHFFGQPTVANIATIILQESDHPEEVHKIASLVLQVAELSDEDVDTMMDTTTLQRERGNDES